MNKFILTLLIGCCGTVLWSAPQIGRTADIRFDYRATGNAAWEKLHVIAVIYPQMPFSVQAGAILTELQKQYKNNVEFFVLLPVNTERVRKFAATHPEFDFTLASDVDLKFLRKLLGRKQDSFFQTSIFNNAGKLLWSGDPADLSMMLKRINEKKYSEREEIRIAALTSSLQAALRSGNAKVIGEAADEILRLRPEQVSAVNAKAYSLELSGNIAGLEKFYRSRIKRFPDDKGNYLALLEAATRLSQLNRTAPEIAGEFIQRFPADKENINTVLWSLLNAMPYDKNVLKCAVENEKLLTQTSGLNAHTSGRMLMTRALIAYRRNRGSEALQLARQALQKTSSPGEKAFVENFIEYITFAIK